MESKKILIMRHGEAANPNHGDSDHSRPLTKEGVESLNRLSATLHESFIKWLPEKVYCSDALRAVQTLNCIKSQWSIKPEVEFCSGFYSKGTDYVIDTATQTDDSIGNILLIGHNPVWSSLVAALSSNHLHLSPGNIVFLEKKSSSWTHALSGTAWEYKQVL